MKKRILALLLSLSMVLGMASTANATEIEKSEGIDLVAEEVYVEPEEVISEEEITDEEPAAEEIPEATTENVAEASVDDVSAEAPNEDVSAEAPNEDVSVEAPIEDVEIISNTYDASTIVRESETIQLSDITRDTLILTVDNSGWYCIRYYDYQKQPVKMIFSDLDNAVSFIYEYKSDALSGAVLDENAVYLEAGHIYSVDFASTLSSGMSKSMSIAFINGYKDLETLSSTIKWFSMRYGKRTNIFKYTAPSTGMYKISAWAEGVYASYNISENYYADSASVDERTTTPYGDFYYHMTAGTDYYFDVYSSDASQDNVAMGVCVNYQGDPVSITAGLKEGSEEISNFDTYRELYNQTMVYSINFSDNTTVSFETNYNDGAAYNDYNNYIKTDSRSMDDLLDMGTVNVTVDFGEDYTAMIPIEVSNGFDKYCKEKTPSTIYTSYYMCDNRYEGDTYTEIGVFQTGNTGYYQFEGDILDDYSPRYSSFNFRITDSNGNIPMYYDGYGYKLVEGVNYGIYLEAKNKKANDGFVYALMLKYVSPSLTKPIISSAANSSSGVSVKWDEVNNAKYYYVYRSTDGETYTNVTKTTSLSFTDTDVENETIYYYKIKATGIDSIDKSTVKSSYSSVKKICRVSKPAISSITKTTSGLRVKWSEISGASYYYVYRSVDDDLFTKVKTTTKLYYDDSDLLENSEKYSYRIYAVTKVDDETYKSSASTTKSYYDLSTPEYIMVSNNGDGLNISWAYMGNVSGYYLYKSKDGGKTYTKLKTITEPNLVDYLDQNVESGKTYYYKVCSYGKDGDVIYKSALTKAESMLFITKPVITSMANSSTGITIKWNAVGGASEYLVYKLIDDICVECMGYVDASSTSFTDKYVTNGKKSTYFISAGVLKGSTYFESPYSDEKSFYYMSRPAISSLTSTKATKAVVKWDANSKAKGYVITYSTKSDFSSGAKTITVTSGTTTGKAISSLTSGKKYYVKVRSYYETSSGKKYYSQWSSVKSVTVK